MLAKTNISKSNKSAWCAVVMFVYLPGGQTLRFALLHRKSVALALEMRASLS